MNLTRFKLLQNILPDGLVLITTMSAYLWTLAPGLTWANAGSDGGDLITAAATGGIAHPSGYPLYLVVARLFQYLPIGTLALRTNLMSAVFTALTAVCVFHIVKGSASSQEGPGRWLAGLAAAYAFGLAPLTWSQAVITEVYALHAFLVALTIYLYTSPISALRTKSNGLDRWRGLVLGLAVGNHISSILLLPAALMLGCVRGQPNLNENVTFAQSGLREIHINSTALGRQFFWFGIGISCYLLLPLMALANPAVNWGNPVTFERFWWLVTGQLYQSYYLQFSIPEVWNHIQAGASLLLQQFGFAGVLIAMAGLVVYGARSRILILTVWIASVYALLAFLYRSPDSYVYLIPTFLCFSIWVGWGTSALMDHLKNRISVLRAGLGLLMLAYFVLRVPTFIKDVDASQDRRAEAFGREVLVAAPKNAILFVTGDKPLFTLWYFHFALRERQDLTVVAVDLLHFDWYQENLRSIYPLLEVPGPFPWPESIVRANTSRPTCFVQYAGRLDLDCSHALK